MAMAQAFVADHRKKRPFYPDAVPKMYPLPVPGDGDLADLYASLTCPIKRCAQVLVEPWVRNLPTKAFLDNANAKRIWVVFELVEVSRQHLGAEPDCLKSSPSFPWITSSMSAQSATVLAIGPAWSKVGSMGKMPV